MHNNYPFPHPCLFLFISLNLDVDCSGNSSSNTHQQPRNHFRSASNSSTGSNAGVDRCWDDEGIEQDHEDELDSVDPRPLSPRSYENMNATFATAR